MKAFVVGVMTLSLFTSVARADIPSIEQACTEFSELKNWLVENKEEALIMTAIPAAALAGGRVIWNILSDRNAMMKLSDLIFESRMTGSKVIGSAMIEGFKKAGLQMGTWGVDQIVFKTDLKTLGSDKIDDVVTSVVTSFRNLNPGHFSEFLGTNASSELVSKLKTLDPTALRRMVVDAIRAAATEPGGLVGWRGPGTDVSSIGGRVADKLIKPTISQLMIS